MSSVKEVAKLASVSVATVSRVLNNDPSVRPETMKKVLKVIDEIGYRPNLLAKNLRKKASNTLVMVLPSMGNPFYAGIANGAQAAVYDTGYNIIVGTTEFNAGQIDTYINMLDTRLADGIILLSSIIDPKVMKQVSKDYPLVVLCNEYYEDNEINSVSIDNEKAAYDATSELIGRGLRQIVYVAGEKESSSVQRRIFGYQRALNEAGITFNPALIVRAENDYEQIKKAVNRLLDNGLNIDGIITHSDVQASYILKGMKEKAFTLPNEVGLISFDGTFLAEVLNPTLTSIAQPMYELGYSSTRLLLSQLKHGSKKSEAKKVILPHQLIKRET